MNRFLLFCFGIAFAVGCVGFEDNSAAALLPEGSDITISAQTDRVDISRAGFERVEDGYKHFWEDEDQIALFTGTTTRSLFSLTDGAESSSGVFSGSATVGEGGYFAVYPYSDKVSLSGSNLTVEYPVVQNWRADKASYDKSSYLMAAYSSNSGLNGLKFKNVTSVVRVSLTGAATITKIELKSIGREAIAGEAELYFADGDVSVALKGSEDIVTLNAPVMLTNDVQHFFLAVAPVALSKGFAVTVYDNEGYAMTKTHTFNRTIERNTVVEMPVFAYTATDKVSDVPVADMLDVVFLADGTAKDISPRAMMVQTFADQQLLKVPFDYTLGQYIGRFDHADRYIKDVVGSHSSGYYKIDFAKDSDFKSRLSDGHTWETLFMMDAQTPTSQDDKWFSAVQSGGVGFVITESDSGQHGIQFSINLSTTGSSNWIRAQSNVYPQRGVWYHAVGVWNKEENLVKIYIDGEKKASVAVDPNAVLFFHKNAIYHWVCVGADTANNSASQGWDGDVAIARIYDQPLTDEQVAVLYAKSYRDRSKAELVTNVSCVAAESVSDGYNFMVKGDNFAAGDALKLRSYDKEYLCETKIYTDGASLTIPSDFESGVYNIELQRGQTKQVLAEVEFTMSSVPQADMLDVVFNADRTAYDASGMQAQIVSNIGDKLMSYPSADGQYIAKFLNQASTAMTTNYYYVPYVSGEAFAAKQADSHTLEAIALIAEPDDVSCLIATHQSGGTALRFQATERDGCTNAIAFVPHVGGAYKYVLSSKSQIEKNKFYHFVGVWNKSTGEVVLYVNGEQAAILTGCTGAFKDSNTLNFVIGGDPGNASGKGQNAWNGDIAVARVYDKPLSASEVTSLYEHALKSWPKESSIRVSEVKHFSGLEVAEGWKYSVYGKGIKTGDRLSLRSITSEVEYNCTTTAIEGRATIVIPAGLPSDSYYIVLHRDEEQLIISTTTLTVTADAILPVKPKNIAHRGCWYVDGKNDLPHNSIAALKRSQEIEGVYSTEFDIWYTADNVLVINHDATINGINIQKSNYSQLANQTLANGEKLPTFEAFLEQYLKDTSIKLMIHVKDHSTTARTIECIDATIAMLRQKGVLDRAEWLMSGYSSAKPVYDRCIVEVPDLVIACSDANENSTYAELGKGMILNYKYTTVDADPSCVKRAHKRGLEMIVWAITTEAEMLKYMSLGIDYFNCNNPALLEELKKLTFIEK